jgi:hypothetical protein
MAVGATGIHAGLWLIAPLVAIGLTSLEVVVVVTVILTALYASPLLSERAFRMLHGPGQPSAASIPQPGLAVLGARRPAVPIETEKMT